MNNQLLLFTVAHKGVNSLPKGRSVIGVGRNGAQLGAPYCDSTGNNISAKNSSYCELTALYWIWKNVSCAYVGLEHYRRFFFTRGQFFGRPLTPKQIEKIVGSGKVIVGKPHKCGCTVWQDYAANHNIADLEYTRQVIAQRYPAYLASFNAVMSSHSYSLANMFVMPKPLMDEYCAWLFDILFRVEEGVDLTNRDSYQLRVFGFIAERLFNVWLHHNNVPLFHAPVYNLGDCPIAVRVRGKLSQIFSK